MTQQVLETATAQEAELAGAARACLVMALDHSKASTIRLTIDTGSTVGPAPTLELPPRALRFFADVLRQMARREPMLLLPQKHELTTQDAAALLNVSRPFVVKEIEAGRLRCRLVNRHRRIEFEEVMRYQAEQKQRAEAALLRLSQLSQEMGESL